MDKSDIIKYFMDRGVLISPGFLESIREDFDYLSFYEQLKKQNSGKPLILNAGLFGGAAHDEKPEEKTQENSQDSQVVLLNKPEIQDKYKVKIISCYEDNLKKKDVQDFVAHYKHRYNSLKNILSNRQELQDSISIARLERKKDGDMVSVIGIVLNKFYTKNGAIKITLEDTTGIFDVLFTKNKEEIYNIANDIVLDEVIGITGVVGNKIIFCNNIYFPDIPVNHELKKAPDEVYAVFISDIHIGIKQFLGGDFANLIKWLKGEFGSQKQREIASKVGYLFVTGDVVEGVGIYPGQENDLDIKDIYEQYDYAAKFFKEVPSDIKIIICGGNHDAIRMSEPQPVFDRSIAKSLYEIPNAYIVTNPSLVNIHSSEIFPGLDVLMYHGFSFIYYANNIPSIRSKGGLKRVDLIMKFLLQKRHLAPSHSSTFYVPDPRFDPLVIDKIPDIFVSGHIHQISASNYRGITIVNSSCWVTQTEDQAKRGISPDPAKIPIVNLRTREVKIMNFLSEESKDEQPT